jgi:hypothetical protein
MMPFMQQLWFIEQRLLPMKQQRPPKTKPLAA